MKFLRNLVYLSLLVGFFATAPGSRGVAQSVTCQGFTFTEGVVIGNNNGSVITKILNNRVYVQRNGVIEDNLGIYYAMSPQNYSNLNQDQWWGCVNPSDPSTSGFNFLGPVIYDPNIGQNTIKCGSATITNNVYLSYWPDNHPNQSPTDPRTYFVPKIVGGVIRIAAIRKENPNTLQPSDLLGGPNDNSGSLNGSFEFNYLNPATGIDLSEDQIKGCIYRSAVKLGDSPPNNCTENPVIGTISSITQTGLTFTFTGNGLPNLKWRIKSGGTTVANGTTGAVNNAGVSLTFGSLGYGDYSLEIEGGDCNSNVSSKAFTISKPNCTAAPTISSISNASATGLTINFTGATSANSINWKIKNSSNSTVANGTKTPTGGTSNMAITFNSLADASYTVEIEGNDCSSTPSSTSFTVSKPNCTAAPVISSISNITATSITVNFTGSTSANSIDWKIKNSSDVTVASGNKNPTGGSSNITIAFSFLANASYTLELTAADCIASASSQGFRINVAKPNCGDGPRITSILNATTSGLTLVFDGSGVTSIAWKILDGPGRNTLLNGEVIPENNHPDIKFNLGNAPYKLEIQGGTTCASTPVTQSFTIGPLPIYISKFEGTAKKEGVALSWTVVSEKNGDGFQVLRFDENVKTPQIIASIPLREEKIGDYSFLDENPSNGINYYQLKQIDTDGSFTTSRIIDVKYEGLYDLFVAPNPAKDFVDVEFESRINGTASFETYTTSGIKISTSRQKVKIGRNKVRLNVSGLSEGDYILKMENGKQSTTRRFLKLR